MPKKLPLEVLAKGMPACITANFGGMLAEAGAVCFENQGHTKGALMRIAGSFQDRFEVSWPPVTDGMKQCYKDMEETTEQGAYGIAILLVKEFLGRIVVERSVKGTGFDYWLGDSSPLPFQRKGRLEVSGILCGSDAQIAARVRQKENQTKVSDGKFPAYIAVVEFGKPGAIFKMR